MTRKNCNPEELKAKAKELLDKAAQIENRQFLRLGKLVDQYAKDNFQNFDLSAFKQEVKKCYS